MLRANRVAQSIINQADGKQHSFSLGPSKWKYIFFCLSGCRHIRLYSSNKVEEHQLYRPITVFRSVILETLSDRKKKEQKKERKENKQQRGSQPLEVVTDGNMLTHPLVWRRVHRPLWDEHWCAHKRVDAETIADVIELHTLPHTHAHIHTQTFAHSIDK